MFRQHEKQMQAPTTNIITQVVCASFAFFHPNIDPNHANSYYIDIIEASRTLTTDSVVKFKIAGEGILKNALSKILNEADQLRRGYSKFIHITVWSMVHQARQCLANFLEG